MHVRFLSRGQSLATSVRTVPISKQLPDLDSLVLVEPESVRVLYVEGGVELREVSNDLVAAELDGGVGVGGHPLEQHFGTHLGLPDRSPTQEQPLLRGIAVQLGLGASVVCDLVGLEAIESPPRSPMFSPIVS